MTARVAEAHAQYSLADLLRVVLKTVSLRRSQHALPEDPEFLHRAFYEVPARVRNVFPPLAELHFITAGAFPYSPDITEALDTLQVSGAISRENPSYERFSAKLHSDTDKVLQKKRQQITGGRDELIKALEKLIDHIDESLPKS